MFQDGSGSVNSTASSDGRPCMSADHPCTRNDVHLDEILNGTGSVVTTSTSDNSCGIIAYKDMV